MVTILSALSKNWPMYFVLYTAFYISNTPIFTFYNPYLKVQVLTFTKCLVYAMRRPSFWLKLVLSYRVLSFFVVFF